MYSMDFMVKSNKKKKKKKKETKKEENLRSRLSFALRSGYLHYKLISDKSAQIRREKRRKKEEEEEKQLLDPAQTASIFLLLPFSFYISRYLPSTTSCDNLEKKNKIK